MAIAGTAKLWTDFERSELEAHYNPRAAVPNGEEYDAARAPVNAEGLAWPGRKADIAYGPDDLMDLDIYVPQDGAKSHPVHIYIHGGYWRSRDKKDFGFVGASLAAKGVMAVVINYPLCPVVTLDVVVDACRQAFAWTVKNIADYGGDPGRITLSGHSAGGHLGAAIIAHDWSGAGLPADPLKGAVLISGVYDPHPTQFISRNVDIGITEEIADRNNFASHAPRLNCPVHVIVGGGEPEGWIGQSASYANHLEAKGLKVAYTVSGNDNHFNLLEQYRDSGSDILSSILAMARQ